jgi:predicted RNA-binding protein with TRAM domain
MAAAIRRSSREEGSALLLALLVLAALSILATTAVVTSMGDRNLSRYERESVQALGVAETGIAYAKRAIVDRAAPLDDADGDGRPDFELTDSLDWGGTYRVVAEASDVKGLGITAYQSNGYTIISEGEFRGARRRVKVEIVHDSFLKFARFVSGNTLAYACDASIRLPSMISASTSVAPASFRSMTIWRVVVPRTSESSTRTIRWPFTA